jgi:hypothetical protein
VSLSSTPGKVSKILSQKQNIQNPDEGVAQVVEHLSFNHEALGSITSTAKTGKFKKERLTVNID